MKVEVIKSKYDEIWYNNRIGETFNVVESDEYDYYILIEDMDFDSSVWRVILKEDGKILL